MFRNIKSVKQQKQLALHKLQHHLLCKFNEQKEVTETKFVTFFMGKKEALAAPLELC